MPLAPLRRREFRVICQAGATPKDDALYYVDRVMFDDATGEIRCWRGSTPFGYTLEQFRLDSRDYLHALQRKFVFFPHDTIMGEFVQRDVKTSERVLNAEIESAKSSERKYDYRVGHDPLGRYVVYRCFYPASHSKREFSRIEPATALATTEEEIAREVLFLCNAIHRPMIDASMYDGYDGDLSGFVPECLPNGEY